MSVSNNQRIAKNTMLLYFRMILTMLVTLYTSRIVLNTLGVEDFGIYDVVGGFVTMFGFLNSAMTAATQRFLTFEIGRQDTTQLRNVFSMSVNIHFLISFIVIILAETLGLWFFNTQLNIPTERIVAARWVYHFSILTLVVNMISVPYNAMIVAHERMNVFAWVSIAEVSSKLVIVYILQLYGSDKLKLYALLMLLVSIFIRLIYGSYCNVKFKESKYHFYWDKPLFFTLLNYSGWNLWGNASSVLYGQGINILLNIFYGPTINAARGIAYQVRGAMNQFVTNFQMAMNPQIIKSYATDNIYYMHQLIFQGAKYSFFLLYALSLPILLETRLILEIWLKIVPEYTVIFTQLTLINILIDSFSKTLMTAAQATGKIRLYQSTIGGIQLLNIPLSYIFLKLNYQPQITITISIIISIMALILRLVILRKLINLKIHDFLIKIVFHSIFVALIALIIPLIFASLVDMEDSIFRLITISSIALVSSLTVIYFFGLQSFERKLITNALRNIKK